MANETPFNVDDKETLTTTIDPDKDYFEELVGEGKRYKDEKSLAKSKVEGELHISNLERELRELRGELKSRVDMETLVTDLKTLSETREQNTEEPNNSDNRNQNEPPSVEQTPENIEKLVTSLVEQREQDNQKKRNFEEVTAKLSELWGSKAEENWVKLRSELNMSEADLREFASSRPQAVMKVAEGFDGVKSEPDFSPFTQGNIRPPVTKENKKDYSYYNNIRKTDPVRYHSKELQAEMHREAQAQGEAFFTSL